MKTYLDCYPCFINQALRAVRMVSTDDGLQKKLVDQSLQILMDLPAGATPPQIAAQIHEMVREQTGVDDPFREMKIRSTRDALELYPELRKRLLASSDPLETAVRLSIAGNIIDFGVDDTHADLGKTVDRVLDQALSIDHLPLLRKRISEVDEILFLADNAGETVFDRLLIETLPVPVTYAVKGGPILNDAVQEDAREAGIESAAREVIENGSRAPGTVLDLCSPSFRERFENAELIIAKGQGNYETLSDAGEKVFCLLQVKCPVLGRDLDAPVGALIVRQSS